MRRCIGTTAFAVLAAVVLSGCSASTATSAPPVVPTLQASVATSAAKLPPRPTTKPERSRHRSPTPPVPNATRVPHHPHGIPAADVPSPRLTPGVALHVGIARICVPGYSASVRDVSDAEKQKVYDRYGVAWVSNRHEVDHLISLEIGGSNAIRNLWPEPYAGRWGARTKDVLEDRLHELVCDGDLGLRAAQHQEATNWVAAYRRYVGVPPILSGPSGSGSGAGGYYASSYPTASTIYCADDPEWRDLSTSYLVHFHTFAQAKRRFPGYHLHRPC